MTLWISSRISLSRLKKAPKYGEVAEKRSPIHLLTRKAQSILGSAFLPAVRVIREEVLARGNAQHVTVLPLSRDRCLSRMVKQNGSLDGNSTG